MTYIDIVFSGPPSEPATFVEVENPAGQSIRVGEWLQRPDGYWVLRIPSPVAPSESTDLDALSAAIWEGLDSPTYYGEVPSQEGVYLAVDRILAAGFRRTEVPVTQGEPSDAQVLAALDARSTRESRAACQSSVPCPSRECAPLCVLLAT